MIDMRYWITICPNAHAQPVDCKRLGSSPHIFAESFENLFFPEFLLTYSNPSSTYSAFHSRSPTQAFTGSVEIHAFLTWNQRQTFCRCFNQSNQ
jgi:hypothetical protein